MEPVTHFLTGAVLSRAGFNRRTSYATLAMTLAAEATDVPHRDPSARNLHCEISFKSL